MSNISRVSENNPIKVEVETVQALKLKHRRKRLIVACDGTWKSSDHASKGDSSYQTNITRLCHALADDGLVDDPDPKHEGQKILIPQIVYYQSGIGVNIPTAIGRKVLGSLGYGVNENILAAYNFLVNNYNEGDELFLFGFSRGSFTCRSLAGLIAKYGILKQEAASKWFAGIWDRYQGTVVDGNWEDERPKLTWDVRIKFMGCWDTVGSLGIPESPFTKLFRINKEYAFHDTRLSDKIDHAYHALALDEHRSAFSPTLWYITPPEAGGDGNLYQCWFPGVHTDVGRGYNDHVPGDIADLSLAWMVDCASPYLSFRDEKLESMMQEGDYAAPVGEDAIKIRAQREQRARSWGMAQLHDSLDLMFKVVGPIVRTPGQYTFEGRYAKNKKGQYEEIPTDGAPVQDLFMTTQTRLLEGITATPPSTPWFTKIGGWIKAPFVLLFSKKPPESTEVYTSERIHSSVRIKMMKDTTYDPPALRGFKLVYFQDENGWSWIKDTVGKDGKVYRTELIEDRISDVSFAGTLVDRDWLQYNRAVEVELPARTPTSFWYKRFTPWATRESNNDDMLKALAASH